MAVAYVQKVGYLNSTGGTASTTIVIPITVTTTVGHTVIAWFRQQRGVYSASSIVDSKGNTWHIDRDALSDSTTYYGPLCICSCVLTTALVSGDTITLTINASAAYRSAGAAEFSGVASSSGLAVIDQNVYATNSGSTATATTATATTAGELAITVGGVGSGSMVITTSDSSSGGTWTDLAIPTSSYLDAGYEIGGGTATAFAGKWTSSGTNITSAVITYEAASSGPVTHNGTGAASFSFTSSSNASHHCSGSATFAFSASGASSHAGTGAASFTFSASSVSSHRGVGAGTFTFASSAPASRGGTSNATFSFVSTTSGQLVKVGHGTATFAFTASGSAHEIWYAIGAAAFSFLASATMYRGAVGTAAFTFIAHTTGGSSLFAHGAATFSFTSSLSGARIATAVATFTFTATTSGKDTHLASGVASFAFAANTRENAHVIPNDYVGHRQIRETGKSYQEG